MKRRHCHVTCVKVPFAFVLSDGRGSLEDFGDDVGRDDDADVVVELDVLFGVFDAAWWSACFADGVQRPGYVGELMGAANLPRFAF